jgi:hypothetical protein
VNPLDWAVLGAAALGLIFSFFAYYSYHPTLAESRGECAHPETIPRPVRGLLNIACNTGTAGAWHGFFGWFGVLLALLAAGLVAFAAFLPRADPRGRSRVVAFGAAGLGLLSTLIALAVIPDWPALTDRVASIGGSYSRSLYDSSIVDGHGFSYWVVLVLLCLLTLVTFLRMRQTAPMRQTALSRSTSVAGPGAVGQPPPGYGPPPG